MRLAIALLAFSLGSLAQEAVNLSSTPSQPPTMLKPGEKADKPSWELRQALKRAAAEKSITEPVEDSRPVCLIVKHKGTLGRRAVWFALTGVPIAPGTKYDYVESANLKNVRMAYKSDEVERMVANGVHVIVLNNKFTTADLAEARKGCPAP